MRNTADSLNAANMAPNSAANAYRGARPPKQDNGAGGPANPNESPFRPMQPAVPFDEGTNRPPRAAAVVELNEANEKD